MSQYVESKKRASGLSPTQLWMLDQACKPLTQAFKHTPFLVGSMLTNSNFRDVDIRLILPDNEHDAYPFNVLTLMGFLVSERLTNLTGLNVDFQFQRMTDANEKHLGPRNPIGCRSLNNFTGDGRKNIEPI